MKGSNGFLFFPSTIKGVVIVLSTIIPAAEPDGVIVMALKVKKSRMKRSITDNDDDIKCVWLLRL